MSQKCICALLIYISRSKGDRLIRGCVASLHVSSVQNGHHQHQCSVDNDVQQGVIILVLFAVEWWRNQFQFYVSGAGVFLRIHYSKSLTR